MPVSDDNIDGKTYAKLVRRKSTGKKRKAKKQ